MGNQEILQMPQNWCNDWQKVLLLYTATSSEMILLGGIAALLSTLYFNCFFHHLQPAKLKSDGEMSE